MIKVGSRVRYIRIDSEEDVALGFYPPVGTLGTVMDTEPTTIVVAWDYGTSDDGVWYCGYEDVEEAEQNEAEILAQKLLVYDPFIDIPFDTICKVAQAVINLGYTRREEIR